MERGRSVGAVLAELLPADGPLLEVGIGDPDAGARAELLKRYGTVRPRRLVFADPDLPAAAGC